MSAEEHALLAAALDGMAAIATNDVPRIAAYLAEDWVIVSDSGACTVTSRRPATRRGRASYPAAANRRSGR